MDRREPLARRIGLLALILVALALLSVVGYVLITEDRAVGAADEEDRPEFTVDLSSPPVFEFPTSARSFDPSLNQFVDRFVRMCLGVRYSEFRRMYTRRLDPPNARAFVSMFNAVEKVRVVALDKLPPLKSVPDPAYRLVAEYDLREFAVKRGRKTRRIQVAVFQEEGEWVIAPLPKGSAEQLSAVLSGTTQPAREDDEL